ncbi:S8 family serine peptidase [Litorihabitans aurantiacus]|uniref:Peptidase S8 n=1 Tax=Litorihabitans aurantiacus TaxID=1930061 RepID=A0AA37XEB6_9MICO|nr:S8 family serine peptidase [Litorihabitans aurantiacus]GMA31638.1 peptidase S8 [Litorihabitans aurantiacus]
MRSGAHGTHVAGTAAGWGVSADGATFQGDYGTLTAEDQLGMAIGPGAAPEADLVALKVFGCAGSTWVVGDALDWLGDPTNALAEQVTVVNLSLGETFGNADDPENDQIDALVAAGKSFVISAGNSGDVTEIAGSPGNANASIMVANSVSGTSDYAGISLTVDGVEDTAPSQYSIAYEFPDGPVGPSDVVALTPGSLAYNSGCETYSEEDAERVEGATVVVAWNDDAALPCGSAARTANAADAGAAGVLFSNVADGFATALTGADTIPTAQLFASDTADLLDYDAASGEITVLAPFSVTFDDTLVFRGVTVPESVDTLNASSSRGGHSVLGTNKPDVAAPGTSIVSANVGTGNGTLNYTGTSMAAPHAAGIVALTRQAHPGWTATQVKAGVVNTATHDVTLGEDVFGPQRVGSGRVDALAATSTSVIAYDKDNPAGVSLGFGVIEVDAPTSVTRTLEVFNSGDAAATVGVGYRPQTEVAGVTYRLSSESVTVPAGGTATVEVTLEVADPAAVRRTLDPTMDEIDPTFGDHREFVTSPQGWIELTGAPQADLLRVPVNAAVKPVSTTTAGPITFGTPQATSTAFGLAGTGLDGSGWLSIVAPFNLLAQSPQVEPADVRSRQAVDLRSIGISEYTVSGADGPEPQLAIGIETYAPWVTLGADVWLQVELETPRGTYTLVAEKAYAASTQTYADQTLAFLYDPDGEAIDAKWVDALTPEVDRNLFDSSAAALPVSLLSLGYTSEEVAAGVELGITVRGMARDLPGDTYDTVSDLSYTTGEGLVFGDGGAPVFEGLPGTSIDVTRPAPAPSTPRASSTEDLGPLDQRVETTPSGEKVLLLHLHNQAGKQGQIIDVGNVVPQVPATQTFTDVPENNQFYADITWLAQQGITTGWDTPTGKEFRPQAPIARDAMAVFLYRLAKPQNYTPPTTSPFIDVPTDNRYYTEIAWAYDAKITTGWDTPAGKEYRPLANINRDAIAAFVYRYAQQAGVDVDSYTTPSTAEFTDVTTTTQYFREISWLEDNGITTGWLNSDGSTYRFEPLSPVQRDAMAAFLYRLNTNVLS